MQQPTQSTPPQKSRSTLQQKLLWSVLGLLIVLVFAMVFVIIEVPTYARNTIYVDTPTRPTPDANELLNKSVENLQQADRELNMINGLNTSFGGILAFVGVLFAALGILGFTSLSGLRDRSDELLQSLKEARTEADKTREALLYLNLGDRYMNQKDKNIPEALKNYKKVRELLPNDSQTNYILGRIYNDIGDYNAAVEAFEASHPTEIANQANVQKELGLAYRRKGPAFYDKAIECLRKATSLNPADADALGILGGLYRRKGDYQQALDSYESALNIDSEYSYALGNLASLSWYLGKQSEALEYFKRAEKAAVARRQPEAYWDYYDLALAQLAAGKMAEAEATYKLAIKETPGKGQFEGVLSNLYLLQTAPQPMPGLDKIVKIIKEARDKSQ